MSRLEKIEEIASESGVSHNKINEIYNKYIMRVFIQCAKKERASDGNLLTLNHPDLEEQTKKLTKRYLRRYLE